MSEPRKSWADQRELFEQLWREGRPLDEIAERLGRPRSSVKTMRCVFNLPPRRARKVKPAQL